MTAALVILAEVAAALLLIGGLLWIVAIMPPSKSAPRAGPDHDLWANSYDGSDHSGTEQES